MLNVSIKICRLGLLLATIGLIGVKACSSGWFGRDCKFQCHCARSTRCDADGECAVNDYCKTGYFGPGCQFWDLVAKDGHSNVATFLKDNNHDTCNHDVSSSSVTISMRKVFLFTWMRIVVNDADVLMNFTVAMNGSAACPTMRKFKVSETIVDVTCEEYYFLNLRISGEIAPAICTVYINGGRNLALKSSTTQSSTLHPGIFFYNSSKAVDGDTSQNYLDRACADTQLESAAVFNLTYSDPVVLYRVRIYSMNGQEARLHRLIFETRSANNRVITRYTDASSSPQNVYDFLVREQDLVILVSIKQSPSVPAYDKYLTICEVQTYGDLPCPYDKYGLQCEAECQCKNEEICLYATGVCGVGCPPGFYGRHCTSRCHYDCPSGMCSPRTGECGNCSAGLMGENCDTECTLGRFGPNCQFTCSANCTNFCHKDTGICRCAEGFTGTNCTDCEPGFFGESCTNPCPKPCNKSCNQVTGACLSCKENQAGYNCSDCISNYYGSSCSLRCPENCLDGKCHKETGACLSCKSGFHGSICGECKPDYYGSSCSLRCPENCLDGKCHKETGACLSCKSGFHGGDCGVAETDTITHWMYLIPILILIVTSLLLFFCLRRRRPLDDGEQEKH